MDDKKLRIIFLSVVGVILLSTIVYFIYLMMPEKDISIFPKEVSAFPDDTSKIYNNKIKAYNELEDESRKDSLDNLVNVDFGTLFSSHSETPQPEPENIPTVEENTKKVIDNKMEAPKPTSKPKSALTFKEIEPLPKENTDNKPQEPQQVKYSGFGVYSANKTKESSPKEEVAPQDDYIPAVFDEDTKIVNNSAIVLILKSDATIQGISFKRNATCYGYAKDAGDYFDVNITSIKNTNGKSYRLNSLIVFNEKYNRGLPHEGRIDNSIKEGVNESSEDISQTVTGSPTQTGLAIGSKIVNSTVRSIARTRTVQLPVIQGYRVYLKSE